MLPTVLLHQDKPLSSPFPVDSFAAMSFESGTAPRRLLQTHGAFINAVLTPNLKQKRHYNVGAHLHLPEMGGPPEQAQNNKRLNANMSFTSNDEVFDVREGEILVYSQTESGFPAHRRGCLFSSLNGMKVAGTASVQPGPTVAYKEMCDKTDPRAALHDSDLRYVGLCQNSFVSSNTALSEQGMAVQVSGIKTIINDSEETINIGDKLMVDTMKRVPSKVRKGIPNEKVRLVLRKVPQGFVPKRAIDKALEKIQAARAGGDDEKFGEAQVADSDPDVMHDAVTDDVVKNIAALVIAEYRRAGHWIVGVAENSARHGEQLDVLLTKPSFV